MGWIKQHKCKEIKNDESEEVDAGNIIIEEANVLDMPFDDETFDITTAFSTVFFWQDIINAFREVKRILKPGGKFYIIQGINGTDNYEPKKDVDLEGAVFYNDMEFKDMLQEAGYSKITCFIRQLKENKKLIRIYDYEIFDEELIDETHMDDIDPEKIDSPEWLCVMAQK